MGYQFEAGDRSVEAAVRRIAREEAEGALGQLDAEGPLAPRVHEMRKAVKKMRGLLRLVRPVFPDARAENAVLRDAGLGISSLRDSAVLLDTAALLAKGMEEGRREALLAPFRSSAAAHDEAAEAAHLPPFRAAMEGLRDRAEGWRLRRGGWRAIEPGLSATWRAARTTMAEAVRDGAAPEAAHEWRKRAKDHWYEARLLQPVFPALMRAHVEAADRLGDLLGQVHDLDVLSERLAQTDLAPDLVDEARAEAAARRAALWTEAGGIGRRLMAEKPSALAARWGAWWRLRDRPQA